MLQQDSQSNECSDVRTALQHAYLEVSVKLVLVDTDEGSVVISKCYTASTVLQTTPPPVSWHREMCRDSTDAWSLVYWQPLLSATALSRCNTGDVCV